MDFHPEDLLISLINIAVLFVLLRLILWKHIYSFLSARSERIQAELEDVEEQRRGADALRQEYEGKLDGIEAQGRDLMRESQIRASKEAEEIMNETREKTKGMMREAHDRIEEEKERALAGVQREVAELATGMAARILKREVSPEDSQNAVEDFFKEGS